VDGRVSIEKRRSRRTAAAEVADKMADAVAYLSRVADRAGMEEISADLTSIRERLALEAKSEPPVSRRTKIHSRKFK
jgi:hypothetical protein